MVKTLLVASVLVAQTATPIFRFETDGFWLNLHHFLYVLGRVEAKMPDIKREAVAGAPADEAQGLKTLSDSERQAWRRAVTAYANGLSKLEATFDRRVYDVTNAVRRASSDRDAGSLQIDVAVAEALDRAAQIYRKAWWPQHRDANRKWLQSMQGPLKKFGPQILAYVTRVYQEPWMAGGFPGECQRLDPLGGCVLHLRFTAGRRHLEPRQPGVARFRDHVSRGDASMG